MEPAIGYKVVVIALFCALSGVRIYYRLRMGRLIYRPEVKEEGAWVLALRLVLTGLLFAVVYLYLFLPGRIAWTIVSPSNAFRVPAALLAFSSIALLAWAHRELGRNFDVTLRLRPGHRLVTSGPYRYVRHPIYVAYLLFFLSISGVSGCLAIGLIGILVIGLLMTVRLKREEAQLLEVHGEHYRVYTERTGRFLPFRSRNRARTSSGPGKEEETRES